MVTLPRTIRHLGLLLALLAACGPGGSPSVTGVAGPASRSVLTYADLIGGVEFDSPVDDAALAMPRGAASPGHAFEGRLELVGEASNGAVKILRGDLPPLEAHLPEFEFEYVQWQGYLIPVRRGLIVTAGSSWDYILEPGRVWQEPGDQGLSRASLPFALVPKGANGVFNGTLTFLFDDRRVSRVWYQVTQEITTDTRADWWGLLDAAYHPGPVADAAGVRAGFEKELARRLPTRPLKQLAEDYPGVDPDAFGQGVSPEHLNWAGVVVNGVNYLGGCRTRHGVYPYCEWMRVPSYSTAKSAFPGLAAMRLAQTYGPQVLDLLIKDYVPEYAASPGDWERVTFNHALDMATGNFRSSDYMADDNGTRMGRYFGTQPYAARMAAAFDWPHSAAPGVRWVYRTSDTFIVTRAMQNYLQSQAGDQADLFDFVVDELYRPLHIGPGAHTSLRTADDNWQGQADGGYGLWWIPDDIAKLARFLNNHGGRIDDEQILHPGLLAAALQQDPADRGMQIDARRMYNNLFWGMRYGPTQGYGCEFWVVQMLGVSGNVVALMPNGVTYYYFSDNQEFTWDTAVREADKIAPLCP